MRFFLALLAGLFIISCNQKNSGNVAVASSDTLKKSAPGQILTGYSDFTLFMDSIISRKNMVFDTAKPEVSDDGYFDKEEGPMLSEPRSMHIGKEKFLLSKVITVNHNEKILDETSGRALEFDSVLSFSFNKHKYAWIRAHGRDCNGTTCMFTYELLADFGNHRIHLFFEPELQPYCHFYFGDVDGSGKLGVLVPEIIATNFENPYGDSMLISLTPWILNSSGYFEQKKDGKFGSALIGSFLSGYIRIDGEINWSNWTDYRGRR